MNQLTFLLPIKPLSINKKFNIHRFSKIMIKSKEAQAYEAEVNNLLTGIYDDLMDLISFYDPKRHCISFDLEIFVPQHEFFTKQRTINQRCLDVTNSFKMLEDTLFKRIGIDDSQITQASVIKQPWKRNTWSCIVKLTLLPIPKSSYLESALLSSQ